MATTLALLLSAVLLTAGCDTGAGPASPSASAAAAPALPVEILAVQPRDLSRVVQLAGPVEPLQTVRLAARSEGVLTEVLAQEGDQVEAGQVLARIDVREQRAELDRARARLREREAAFRRMESLQSSSHIDEASFEAARAELAIAASELRLWQTRVDAGTVRAETGGTVLARAFEAGEAVSRHEMLFRLADLTRLVVRLGVSELDLAGLEEGAKVPLTIDALGDETPLPGTIRRIFPAADPGGRLVTVEVAIPAAAAPRIRPGYLARAELLTDHRPDVLAIPAGAMAADPDGHFVMLVGANQRLERRAVTPGILRGPWREITSGLTPGDRVVAANPREMTAGERVRIVRQLDG